MLKRIMAIMMTVTMLLTSMSCIVYGESSDNAVDGVIQNLAKRTPEDRASIVNALVPLIITDTGIDALEYYIEDYNPESSQIFDVVVGKIFDFADKEAIMSMFGYLRLIDEGIREDYFVGFQKRKERELSANAKLALESFLTRQSKLHDGLGKLLEEDGITPGVVARLLEIPHKINEGKPLLKNAPTGFGIYEISDSLRENMQKAIDSGVFGDISVDEAMAAAVSYINKELAPVSEVEIKTVLSEIGVYKFVPSEFAYSAGSGGAISGEDKTDISDGKIGYRYIGKDNDKGYDVIEIYKIENGNKITSGGLNNDMVLSLKVSSPYTMIYKIEDEGFEAVRYSVYENGELRCKIGKLGQYAVRIMKPHFEDVDGWGKEYIEALYNRGIISGKSEKYFEPDDNITREEFVKLIVETAGMSKMWTDEFSDVSPDAWYAGYIGSAKNGGVINGIGDGKFGVGENITRQDMSKIIFDLLVKDGYVKYSKKTPVFADGGEIAEYATAAVSTLYDLGVVSGDDEGNFNPADNATRQEASKLIYKLLGFYVK